MQHCHAELDSASHYIPWIDSEINSEWHSSFQTTHIKYVMQHCHAELDSASHFIPWIDPEINSGWHILNKFIPIFSKIQDNW